jgi:hypothetical protein
LESTGLNNNKKCAEIYEGVDRDDFNTIGTFRRGCILAKHFEKNKLITESLFLNMSHFYTQIKKNVIIFVKRNNNLTILILFIIGIIF